MPDNVRIAIIGAGAMGEAIISGMLRQQVVTPDQIIAAEPGRERREELHARYHIDVTADNMRAASQGQVVIFAVKPQVIVDVLRPIQGTLTRATLCLSILAGTPISTFTSLLQHSAMVRAMPNTPAQIGAGMTVWTATPDVNEQQRNLARRVLASLGREHYVENEHYLDMATAINGSGPAYIFLMLESMIDAAVHLGFARPIAEELVLQTMLGAVRYAQESGTHPALLRNAVTSPGGTTAAALSELERGGLRTVLSDAIWAAYHRSQELGKR